AEQYEAQIKAQDIRNEQQKMEFKMLSSQINPHFLYNTLETIRMKALTSGDTEVANAICLLGKSMRYVLENTGNKDTTLAKELEHLKVYLEIQELRFGDRLDYMINIQEGLLPENYRMMGLLLQPVAENAIIHGLADREEGGRVNIDVYSTDNILCIDISDNGCGIEKEQLEALNSSLDSYGGESRTNSIGLYNINRRIRLSYGEDFGIRIESVSGSWTKVSIILPLMID
ncbi:MAG: histidine kinase, partial [Lachnospiraceae bacterium]|nr:histidine kinase [Lachnospiraceae bacterium]